MAQVGYVHVQECPLDDKADFGYQIEEMLRSMFDIHGSGGNFFAGGYTLVEGRC